MKILGFILSALHNPFKFINIEKLFQIITASKKLIRHLYKELTSVSNLLFLHHRASAISKRNEILRKIEKINV